MESLEDLKLERALKRANDAFYKEREKTIKKLRWLKSVARTERREKNNLSKMLIEVANECN